MKKLLQINEEIFKMKTMLRKGWLIKGAKAENGRVESVAEHCFSTCMLALEIINKEKLELDELKVLKLALYHELGEIDVGDITPYDNVSAEEKHNRELVAVERIAKQYNMPEMLEVWLEFEEQSGTYEKNEIFYEFSYRVLDLFEEKGHYLDASSIMIYAANWMY